MNPKQRQFCIEYMVDKNATNAAIRAGYSKKTAQQIGSRLLLNVVIADEIAKLIKDQEIKTLVTAEYVINNLREVVERCMQHKPVMIFDKVEKEYVQKKMSVKNEATGEIKSEGVWEFDANGANKALELLGKHLNIFKEDDSKPQTIIIELSNYGKSKK